MICKKCKWDCIEGVKVIDEEHRKCTELIIPHIEVGDYFCPNCGIEKMSLWGI